MEIRDLVRWHLVPQYRETLDTHLDTSTREANAEQWFTKQWEDGQWRIRNCPGKSVLKKVRNWAQNGFGLTLTTKLIMDALTECPADIADTAQKLQTYFYGDTSGV